MVSYLRNQKVSPTPQHTLTWALLLGEPQVPSGGIVRVLQVSLSFSVQVFSNFYFSLYILLLINSMTFMHLADA